MEDFESVQGLKEAKENFAMCSFRSPTVLLLLLLFVCLFVCLFFSSSQNYHKWRPLVCCLAVLSIASGFLCNCLATGGLLYVSHHNYPGGTALYKLHQMLGNQNQGGNHHTS